jgi:hypothetical protein
MDITEELEKILEPLSKKFVTVPFAIVEIKELFVKLVEEELPALHSPQGDSLLLAYINGINDSKVYLLEAIRGNEETKTLINDSGGETKI